MTLSLSACAAPMTLERAQLELDNPAGSPRAQLAAMQLHDETDPVDPQYLQSLHGIIWRPGYTTPVREAALVRLERHDLENLKRTIRQRMPRLTALHWLERLSQIIAERGWIDLTPALVSSWARPMPIASDEADRPEYQALVTLYGEEQVVDVIFDLFIESDGPAQQGLRGRCWDLMHRLGERQRMVDLIASAEVQGDDAMLIDLREGATKLGIIPRNREEILWMRKLREPSREAFWTEAVEAAAMVPDDVRATLELRDLPIVVSTARHRPELLRASDTQLYERLADDLQSKRHYDSRANYGNLRGSSAERLFKHRDVLTWGDLAAMLIAIEAFKVPQVIDHLFDYAQRDERDTSTEYGGIVALDRRGRFQLLEFLPTFRRHDNEFNAPQDMLDAGYTALFHFHFHAQRFRNDEHAGPGFGDLNYADNTRANCLVFTYINRDTLNMDFYRHGGVVVDLGEIKRRD